MTKTTTRGTRTPSSKTVPSKKPPRAATTAARKSGAKASVPAAEITPDLRQRMIAEAAYLRAERRGFGSGDPLDDWLSAEREVDMLLAGRARHIAH